MAKHKQLFCLEGQFEGFTAGSKSPFKYLSLRSHDQHHVIKLPKAVQMMLFRHLQVGDAIRVMGNESIDKETGEPKLKAKEVLRIKALETVSSHAAGSLAAPISKPKGKASKILICKKSGCRKRGALQVCDQVEAVLADQGLTDTVQIKLTGCMDKCKAGPNLVVMPHKQRYTKVKPGQVTTLIAQHFQPNEVG